MRSKGNEEHSENLSSRFLFVVCGLLDVIVESLPQAGMRAVLSWHL